MRIELQYPYSRDYKVGYLNVGSEGRNMLVLISNDGTKHCTSYARYVVCTNLGRYLSNEEEVDHINNDKTDDRLENLQILSKADNIRKSANAHRKTLKHGTYAMYRTNGCRCASCVMANKEMQKRSYEKHRCERILYKRRKRLLSNSNNY